MKVGKFIATAMILASSKDGFQSSSHWSQNPQSPRTSGALVCHHSFFEKCDLNFLDARSADRNWNCSP